MSVQMWDGSVQGEHGKVDRMRSKPAAKSSSLGARPWKWRQQLEVLGMLGPGFGWYGDAQIFSWSWDQQGRKQRKSTFKVRCATLESLTAPVSLKWRRSGPYPMQSGISPGALGENTLNSIINLDIGRVCILYRQRRKKNRNYQVVWVPSYKRSEVIVVLPI